MDSPHQVRIIDNLGIRIPLNIGAANKTILASMESGQAEAIINMLLTSASQKEKLYHQVHAAKAGGYAVSYGERTEGTASVAAPIIGYRDQVVGALSIGILSSHITDDRLSELIRKVKEAAAEISLKIGKTP